MKKIYSEVMEMAEHFTE